jgi:transcriptional/translational regulatory protein YebC/TACO1
MKTRYRLIHRGRGHGTFYCVDSKTRKRTSLGKATKGEARQIVDAKNQAERQPMLNLQLAKAYLAGTDAEMPKRTWQHALEVVTETKRGANKERWKRVAKDRALPCCGRR